MYRWMVQVAEVLVKRGVIEAVLVVRLVLLLLATRLGTLVICGWLCVSENWPYVNDFSSLCVEKREKVIQKWLKNSVFTPVRIAFVYLRLLCAYVFFSRVNYLHYALHFT